MCAPAVPNTHGSLSPQVSRSFLALSHGRGSGEKVEEVFSPQGWMQWGRQLGTGQIDTQDLIWRLQECGPCSVLARVPLWCCLLGSAGGFPPALLMPPGAQRSLGRAQAFPCCCVNPWVLGSGACVLLTPCICFQPKVSTLGVVQGPSKDKVAILTIDECDASVALQFGSEIGNYSCAAEGVQTSSKK